MNKGTKQDCKDGFVWDWIHKYSRRVYNWGPGVGKYIKRRLSKQRRQEWKQTKQLIDEE